MSEIVLGLATSHSPLLTFTAEMWLERAKDDRQMQRLTISDGRTLTYGDLEIERGAPYAAAAELGALQRQEAAAQSALDRLADELATVAPDLVVIVGDDQEELFGPVCTPAIAIYYGDDLVMMPLAKVRQNLPEWRKVAYTGYMMDEPHRHPAAPSYAYGLIERLVELGVDLGASSRVVDPELAGFGHAYGFIVARLFRGKQIPIVPVMLNTYFPPNVPSAMRAHDIGRALRTAIEASPDELRVAVIASGGLSHFVTDTALDKTVMDAIAKGDPKPLRTLPRTALRSGSSEILNWVMTAGAVDHLPAAWGEYLPVYRTPVGTGVGLGFACWRAAGPDS